jgi:hypothetical protein
MDELVKGASKNRFSYAFGTTTHLCTIADVVFPHDLTSRFYRLDLLGDYAAQTTVASKFVGE